ncbi:hypothetical protein EGT50_08875 [Rhodococcus xishaensis]|uniref:Uncharacterized protein n=1 Tax=Rhodococcus xishaensis TaxID=2487364 RepID=A0A438AVU6_9NOCA|nr:hypothetical protein EGT50_08875 [Rhodococcus xishaensis]
MPGDPVGGVSVMPSIATTDTVPSTLSAKGGGCTMPAPDGRLEVLAKHVRLFIGGHPDAWLFPGENDGQPWHQNSLGYRCARHDRRRAEHER